MPARRARRSGGGGAGSSLKQTTRRRAALRVGDSTSRLRRAGRAPGRPSRHAPSPMGTQPAHGLLRAVRRARVPIQERQRGSPRGAAEGSSVRQHRSDPCCAQPTSRGLDRLRARTKPQTIELRVSPSHRDRPIPPDDGSRPPVDFMRTDRLLERVASPAGRSLDHCDRVKHSQERRVL